MYDVISSSVRLRYSLELAANGMKRGSYSCLGKMQCLDMLAAHETAWRTLSWSENAPVDVPVGWGEPVSVSGNVICFRSKLDVPHEQLLILRVPSKLRAVTMKSWRLQLPYDVKDVCIDSGQDLLIYQYGYVRSVVCRISILTTILFQDQIFLCLLPSERGAPFSGTSYWFLRRYQQLAIPHGEHAHLW